MTAINIRKSLTTNKHIAPLAVLRIAFGAVMLFSVIRFAWKGWIAAYYITPKYFFSFYRFEWVKPLPAAGMYTIFVVMAVAALFVMLGYLYRISIVSFFLCFCYVELLDKTYYLNHYYFVSIFTFLMILVPANRYFSLDVLRKPFLKVIEVPAWTINIFKLQLCIVYFYAGLSKLTYDWLFRAMPLKIWLPANEYFPVIGPLLRQEWTAWAFSWFGALYDLVIWIFLLNKKTRSTAYFFVIIFHVLTAWLFKIGMFPYIMIFVTIIFFSEDFHKNLLNKMAGIFGRREKVAVTQFEWKPSPMKRRILFPLLAVYFTIQLLAPFRFLLYPGELSWTEEGFRFSWRVMLMEKGGTAFFYVKDAATGRSSEVNNAEFLTPMQEKMMNTQPDMMLQYAHFLGDTWKKKGISQPIVTVESYVTLNGSGSRLFVDSSVDLYKEQESFSHKSWILPFGQTIKHQ